MIFAMNSRVTQRILSTGLTRARLRIAPCFAPISLSWFLRSVNSKAVLQKFQAWCLEKGKDENNWKHLGEFDEENGWIIGGPDKAKRWIKEEGYYYALREVYQSQLRAWGEYIVIKPEFEKEIVNKTQRMRYFIQESEKSSALWDKTTKNAIAGWRSAVGIFELEQAS